MYRRRALIDRQTDRQTHRLTDGIGDKPVPIPACTLLYYSDAANNTKFADVSKARPDGD